MNVVSVALTSNYSSVLSLQGLDTNGPIAFSLSVGETASDAFVLWGTVDAAAVDNTNAYNLGAFTGGALNLPKGIASQAKTWPFVLVQRTSGSTAGSLFVAGNPAASPAVVSTAAPVVTAGYSAVLTLTTLNAETIRIGGSRQMVVGDVFDVFLSDDVALASSTGAFYAGRITGGGGTYQNSVLVSGYNYAIIQRVSGSTAGTMIAAGVSPSTSGGGILDLTTLAVGDTAVNGAIGALTAAASVDIYNSFVLTQTTAGVTATLPSPTITTAGRVAFVMNNDTSTQSITMYGETLGVGSLQIFDWDGTAWVGGRNVTAGGNAFGAALSIGTTDNQTFSLLANNTAGYSDTGVASTVGRTTGASSALIQSGTGGVTLRTTGVGPITLSGSDIISTSGVATIADGTGSLGTAAATVDLTSMLLVNQTTPVVLYASMRTLPAPTTTTVGRKVTVCNVGTAAFLLGDSVQLQGVNLIPGTVPGLAASANKGQAATFTWNGTAWVPDDPGPGAPAVQAALADAPADIPRQGRYTVYRMPTLATSRVLTATLTGALIGDIIDVVRDDGGSAVTLTINNNAGVALAVMPASKKGTARIGYLGTGDWQLLLGGAF